MSLFNPYDEYTPSGGNFWKEALHFILDIGSGLWLLVFSPIGIVAAGIAWMTWGGALLITLAVLGFGGFIIGGLLGGFSLVRFILFERSEETLSILTVRLFMIAGVVSLVFSVAGLITIVVILGKIFGS